MAIFWVLPRPSFGTVQARTHFWGLLIQSDNFPFHGEPWSFFVSKFQLTRDRLTDWLTDWLTDTRILRIDIFSKIKVSNSDPIQSNNIGLKKSIWIYLQSIIWKSSKEHVAKNISHCTHITYLTFFFYSPSPTIEVGSILLERQLYICGCNSSQKNRLD